MRARIDINEVEMRTKIRAKYLRAMENEEWGLLPGDVYVKSFLRTYADFLGLDSRQLLDDYRRRYERPVDHDARPIAPLGRERERRGGRPGGGFSVPPWAAIAVAVVAIFAVLEVIGLGGGGTGTTTSTTTSSSSLTASGQTKRHRRPHHRATAVPGSSGARSTTATVKLQLVPTGAVWVCLVDGTGKTLIPGVIYDTGQTIPTKRAAKLLLRLGNASVTMKVNGKPFTVPATGQPVGFEITPSATKPLAAAQQPSCP